MMRRTVILSLVFISVVVGCSRPDQPANGNSSVDAGTPVSGDWVVVRIDTEPETLNPPLATTTNANYAMWGANHSQIFEFLLQYNTEDWRLTEPLLAESYPEISDDHLTYTYTVRDGVKWHDGQPLTVEDVLFTYKAAMCPLVDSASYRSYFTKMTNVEILEGRKIRFSFSEPNVLNVNNTAGELAIIPKHVFDPEGVLDGFTYKDIIGAKGRTDPKIKEFSDRFNKHPNNRMPIGTGPYKFEKWDTGKEIVLVRNEEYWGKKANVDRIVYRIISDYPAALTALKSGDVDLNPRMTPIQYAQQTSGQAFDSQFTKAKYSIPQYYFIGWNQERPFFKDKRVRQALTMLVNRDQIIETLRFGLAKTAATAFTPGSANFNPNIKPYPYDPKRAGELLDEAGWKDHDGDGIRDKDGVPFKFEFLGASGSAFTMQLLPILKDEFRKAGIQMTERMLEFTVFVSSNLDHKYDAAASAWLSPLESDPFQILHSSSIANRGSNWVSFRNAESDRLLEEGRLEFDPEKRKQIYWRWQELIHDEQPYTFLFYPEESAAYQNRFQNVQWLPNRPGYDLTGWFVPKQVQKYTAANP
jgi:peptide/nickel transport system substrate-binding protein